MNVAMGYDKTKNEPTEGDVKSKYIFRSTPH